MRVSVSTRGADGDLAGSYAQTAISPGGHFVAFVSDATNLVGGDANGTVDIFLRDRNTDRDRLLDEPGAVKTVRVNLSSAGVQANNGSGFPVVTGGGRFVAFESLASNLVRGDDNAAWDIFVRDRDSDRDGRLDEARTVRTRRLSVSSEGVQANDHSQFATFARNSRFVAFSSYADNLEPGDTNGVGDIFDRDRDSDRDRIFDEGGAVRTARVSISSADGESDGESSYPAISANGRFVTFRSSGTNLVSEDTNGVDDIFVRDRDADRDGIFDEPGAVRTVRVNLSTEGLETDGAVSASTISASGRFVGFGSAATNLVASDTNGVWDTFFRDRDADGDGVFDEPGAVATIRTSVTSLNTQASDGSGTPALSANGRWMVFTSSAREFHLDGSPNQDVFARGPLR